ncbi:MAG TPA: DUF2520 domain-containing protein [Acidimicrobiales bacterium]|nr:DUF2520 domain-containing protein [Acidimicrobiales bacterium]
MNIAIVGAGRAGMSFSLALSAVRHRVQLVHHDEIDEISPSDLVLLCVPDGAIEETAARLAPCEDRVLAHCAGSRTLDVLAGHPRVGSLHPLATLPSPERGAPRLLGATYCVAGDALVDDVVASLGGHVLALADDQRTLYHATASVAANHLVALLGHVARLAEATGLNLDNFVPLARMALEDVAEAGPVVALTGPASRGDLATIDAHLAAMAESERATYVAMANAALALAEQRHLTLLA